MKSTVTITYRQPIGEGNLTHAIELREDASAAVRARHLSQQIVERGFTIEEEADGLATYIPAWRVVEISCETE